MRLVRKEQSHWKRETAILTKMSRIGILGPVAEPDVLGSTYVHGAPTLENGNYQMDTHGLCKYDDVLVIEGKSTDVIRFITA